MSENFKLLALLMETKMLALVLVGFLVAALGVMGQSGFDAVKAMGDFPICGVS